jgi:hypothetical protein
VNENELLLDTREQVTWTPAEWKRLQRSVALFERQDIGVHLRCKRTLCPSPLMHFGRTEDGVVFIRCGCRTRYVRARARTTKH